MDGAIAQALKEARSSQDEEDSARADAGLDAIANLAGVQRRTRRDSQIQGIMDEAEEEFGHGHGGGT